MSSKSIAVKPWIVVVGGFLGAGKTTLILAAARELERQGQRCAVILNDQGSRLVDTSFAVLQGLQAAEVTGGCFCCKLSDLVDKAEELRAYAPDVIFAEPVGSCTDIGATVLRPLQEYDGSYRVAPLTVLVDPARAQSLLRNDSDRHLSYLFQKQIEEADLVCFTKSDRRPSNGEAPSLRPGLPVRRICATTGHGVLAWLHEVTSGGVVPASANLEIDYAQYAEAEAALAWLNLEAVLEPVIPLPMAMVLGPLADSIDKELTAAGISIVHLKMVVTSSTGFVKAASCANGQEPLVEGGLDASPSSKHALLLNLRALGSANQVREIVEREIARFNGGVRIVRLECFTPAAPKPERRKPGSAIPTYWDTLC